MTFNKNYSGVLWKGDTMKKLIGILSVFCILITSSNICLAARDVYVCTNNAGEDIYVDVDSIKGWSDEFQANVKIGKKRYVIAFVTQNGVTMCGGKGHSPEIVTRGTPVYQLYQFCKSRVKSVYE